ncbi:aldose epimerase family protein [Niallia circulans]|uniref:aldose epimerase family protein n=1 Tax=Niallia circulans TaxID=1397 RepID=UPI00155F6E40|nr:aldose epimerase family protein [Niallia circulans]NRG32107.1 galactose mutarotase [Niallia circulans]
MNYSKRSMGEVNGADVMEFTFTNNNGMSFSSMNYGCIITKIIVPDKEGNKENVVLGFETLEEYRENKGPYLGAIVGRVAGRIKEGKFELNGKEYRLNTNTPPNHLHGGNIGWSEVVFASSIVEKDDAIGIRYTYHSPDGEEGYPGNFELTVDYLLTNDNEIILSYSGKTDKETPVTVTNHSYFNLSGNNKRDILEHELIADVDRFLELREDFIPTGKMIPTNNTPFDFAEGKALKEGKDNDFEQNRIVGNGYDHPLVFAENGSHSAILRDRESGREMSLITNQPAVVLYTGNMLEDQYRFNGVIAKKYLGVCLETQGLPDAVNHPQFPSVVLKPGETYHAETKLKFRVTE